MSIVIEGTFSGSGNLSICAKCSNNQQHCGAPQLIRALSMSALRFAIVHVSIFPAGTLDGVLFLAMMVTSSGVGIVTKGNVMGHMDELL